MWLCVNDIRSGISFGEFSRKMKKGLSFKREREKMGSSGDDDDDTMGTFAPTAYSEKKPDNPWDASSVEWPEIVTTLELTVALFVVLLALFEVKRHRLSVYAPRLRHFNQEERAHRLPNDPAVLMGGCRRWPLAWAWLVCRVSDDDMRRMIGLDAFVLLRYLKMWRGLFFKGVVFGTVVLLPTYSTGARRESGFYRMTMRNLEKGSTRLWAPYCFAYVWTLLILRALEDESKNYLKWRREFLATTKDEQSDEEDLQAKCSVLVERIPKRLRSDKALSSYFSMLVGSRHVFSATVYLDLRDLEAKLRRRDKEADRFRYALMLARGNEKRRCSRRKEDVAVRAAALDAADEALTAARERALAIEAIQTSKGASSSFGGDGKEEEEEEEAGGVVGPRHTSTVEDFVRSKIADFEQSQLGVLQENEESEKTVRNPLLTEKSSLKPISGMLPVDPTFGAADDLARAAVDASQTTMGGLATTLALESALRNKDLYQPSSTGVVTFCDPGTAADVAQVALTSEPLGLESSQAPPRRDLVWRNVGIPVSAIEWRQQVADLGLWFIAFLFTPLVSLIQALSNLDEIAKLVPPLRPFIEEDRYEYARSLATGYIPVVALLGLLALVPIGLQFIAVQYVGHKSYSAVQRYVLSRNLYFQLLSIFVTTLAGSITSVLKSFAKHPSSLLKLLGKSFPNISAYFVQTLVVKCGFTLGYELARPLPFFFLSATRKYQRLIPILRRSTQQTGTGEQQKSKFKPMPPEFLLGFQVPSLLIVVLIGTLYAAIAPIILLVAFVFFVFAVPVYSRQFLFVYVSTYEAGALYLWPALTYVTTLALIVSQCTLISYLTIRGGVHQASTLIPLPIATFLFYRSLVRFYERPARVLDRQTAVENRLFDATKFEPTLLQHLFRHPALLVDSCNSRDVESELLSQENNDEEQQRDVSSDRTSTSTTASQLWSRHIPAEIDAAGDEIKTE